MKPPLDPASDKVMVRVTFLTKALVAISWVQFLALLGPFAPKDKSLIQRFDFASDWTGLRDALIYRNSERCADISFALNVASLVFLGLAISIFLPPSATNEPISKSLKLAINRLAAAGAVTWIFSFWYLVFYYSRIAFTAFAIAIILSLAFLGWDDWRKSMITLYRVIFFRAAFFAAVTIKEVTEVTDD